MKRIVRGLGALVVLIATLVGVPVALAVLGGNPLPRTLSWSAVGRALFRPDDGTILIGLITVIGWLAWLVFALAVLAELVELASRQRIRVRLPGLGGPRRLAAGLLISVAAMIATAQAISPSAVPAHPIAAVAGPVGSGVVATDAGASSRSITAAQGADVGGNGERLGVRTVADSLAGAPSLPPRGAGSVSPERLPPAAAAHGNGGPRVHVVVEGDDLWSLAEHYYGKGSEWRRIAMANPGVLTGGPDRIVPGWRLAIPDTTAKATGSGPTVLVRAGDSLSSLAERAYGDASDWPRLLEANRAQLSDPDQLVPGMRLAVPRAADHGKPARQRGDDRADSDRGGQRGHRPGGQKSTDGDADQPGSGATTKPSDATASDAEPTTDGTSAPSTEATATTDAPRATESSAPIPTTTATPEGTDDFATIAAGLGSVGALLAAGVIGGLALRRRSQLQTRPLGRRIVATGEGARRAEIVLGHRQRPMSLRTLDLATRAIAVHCRQEAASLPPLRLIRVGSDEIELLVPAATTAAPPGFRTRGASWVLDRRGSAELASATDIEAALRPYPGLVTVGRDTDDREVLVDLEAVGLLTVGARGDESGGDVSAGDESGGDESGGDESGIRDVVAGVLTAMAVELSFSPWVDELALTLVGDFAGLPDALGRHNVTAADDLDEVLDRLEQRAATQRQQQPYAVLGQHRIDPDLAEPWTPEIVLINSPVHDAQRRRLNALLTTEPRVAMAAVVAGPVDHAPWALELAGASTTMAATLRPLGVALVPQLIAPDAQDAVVELVAATGSEDTAPAPWWRSAADEPDPPPDNVTYLGRRFGGWAGEITDGDQGMGQKWTVAAAAHSSLHPVLQLLGPINLVGATGPSPQRAGRQCLEYCGWLLEHPGTSAMAMASALAVAEGTRRSNMSRLRTWLGADPEGNAYLPEAYTGRIVLHPAVSSDWQRFQIITSAGVNKATTSALRAGLELVRGAPLADAAPGQWHWAEELRTDMISAVRDLGVELARRALESGDLDLARWAAARALAAAPGDELLMAARIRTEHLAGNRAETERLTLQVAGHARTLGIDLDPETVSLLQEVMEGQVRARLA